MMKIAAIVFLFGMFFGGMVSISRQQAEPVGHCEQIASSIDLFGDCRR